MRNTKQVFEYLFDFLYKLVLWLFLWPLSLSNSFTVAGIAVIAYLVSFGKQLKLCVFDYILLFLSFYSFFSWLNTDYLGKEFFISQVSSYYILIFALRFLYAGREIFYAFVISMNVYVVCALMIIYLAVQMYYGYQYEVGVLEAVILARLFFVGKSRLLGIFVAFYFVLMFLISTRSTPLVVALMMLPLVVRVPVYVLSFSYVCLIFITPALGIIFDAGDFLYDIMGIDDNAQIRYEMVKGGASLMGIKEFLFGTGFGYPFRDPTYAYEFSHPLLNSERMVYHVSNHNSLFDLFLRFGIFGYLAFCVYFLRVFDFLKIGEIDRYKIVISFVMIYSLVINAYLESTKLTLTFSILVAILMFYKGRGDKTRVICLKGLS